MPINTAAGTLAANFLTWTVIASRVMVCYLPRMVFFVRDERGREAKFGCLDRARATALAWAKASGKNYRIFRSPAESGPRILALIVSAAGERAPRPGER